jgi:hypothetical protein
VDQLDLIIKQVFLQYGPWAIALAAMILYRREIKDFLFAPKNEGAVEKLMASMNDQFAQNLVYFARVEGHVERMLHLLETIKDESIRQSGRMK